MCARDGCVVEFIGVPGVGKSTVAGEAARLLEGAGVPVRLVRSDAPRTGLRLARRARTLGTLVRGLVLRPRACARAIRLARLSRQQSRRDALEVAWGCVLLAGRATERTRGAVVLLDQGWFQAVWSVLLRATAPEDVAGAAADWLERVLPARLVVVSLTSPPSVWQERLRSRGTAVRLEVAAREGRGEEELERAPVILDTVLGLARALSAGENRELRLVEVENGSGSSADAAAGEVLDALRATGLIGGLEADRARAPAP
jgi:hypothetical protein